ncbi:hypothetical protein ACIRL2_29170 [Embleya sp. NPDC127516]|uniref:hypothetical protein n=1 Tax=Embleya sp. NPDC127516 TaxID=3363990 RepID=UPI00380EC8A9
MDRVIIVDLPAAALHCEVDPRLLRQWLHRGRLSHHGYDARRRAMVDLLEVEALVPEESAAQIDHA